MSDVRPITVLLGAVGGQGGGVLIDWLIEAARLAGYPAQATSIPGVAQRTGATTYYVEVFPVRNPARDPVLCLFPSAGDVDVVAALESTEAGRALENGFVGIHTTVVTMTHRIYSTAEKSIAGDGRLPAATILDALGRAAGRLIRVENTTMGSQPNALVFGALIGSGALPIGAGEARQAIDAIGVAVAMNRAAFEQGLAVATGADRGNHPSDGADAEPAFDPAPARFAGAIAALPEALRAVAGHALRRLCDYQGARYARLYLRRLQPFVDVDIRTGDGRDCRLSREVARRLAAWMIHADIMRVAQLKTRRERLERIRQEIAAGPDDIVRVVDFFSPGQAEFAALMPSVFGRWLRREGAAAQAAGGWHLAWPTSTVCGYLGLRLLACLRVFRPFTAAHAQERAAIEAWLDAVQAAAAVAYELGCRTAEVAVWARGYGPVRERGLQQLYALFQDWERRLQDGPADVAQAVEHSLHTARHDPDGACATPA